MSNWLQDIRDDANLAQLSLVGTHNSGCYHTALPSVQCQGASITDQLENGVRFLDIRAGRPSLGGLGGLLGSSDPDDLQVIHGSFPARIPKAFPLDEALGEVYRWIEAHPSETVILSLKGEGQTWEKDDFAELVWAKYLEKDQGRYYLDGQIPQLGQVRGKIVLFRRFAIGGQDLLNKSHGMGIDAHWWDYNTTNDDRGTFEVQDFSEIKEPADVDKKMGYVEDMMKRSEQYNATANAQPKLFLNYTSGSNFWNPACWPAAVAKGFTDKLSTVVGKGSGITIVDYAETDDWKFVKSVNGSNLDFKK
ncbi:hypothetical protein CJU89_4598 [Yarrowia sp. B02]|nr:hypothetical protein CJU89_4598 [Yarrowia sp. B02]